MKNIIIRFILLLCCPLITKAQNVGIGTITPGTKLHIFNGASGGSPFASFQTPLVIENNDHTYINLLSPETKETALLFGKPSNAASGVIMYNNTSTPNGFQFRNNGNLTRMVIDNTGNVGIGLATPTAKLSLTSTGTELAGTAMSNQFRTNAGSLGISPGSELSLASIGFLSSDNSALGIRAYRSSFGTDWTSSVLLLEYDVENSVRAGSAFLALGGNGNLGIGTTNPLSPLHVDGVSLFTPGGSNIQILNGNRIQAYINGGLNLTTYSDDPIKFTTNTSGGSSGGERMRILSNGKVGIGTTTPAALLEVNGYTKLGSDAPSIKVKKLTGTTASTEGGFVDIYLGVDQSKILSLSVMVLNTGVGYSHWYGPNIGGIGVNFFYYNGNEYLTISNYPGDSAGILSKPFKVLLTYEE